MSEAIRSAFLDPTRKRAFGVSFIVVEFRPAKSVQ